MSKTDKLNDLFICWKSEQNKELPESLSKTILKDAKVVKKDYFCKDGIICEEQFEKEKLKVLFIANEANVENDYLEDKVIPSAESSQIESFIKYIESGNDDWRGKLRKRICEIIYPALCNLDEPNLSTVNGCKNANKIAFMNLNKRGGKGNIEKHLYFYCKQYKRFILKEIKIIDPDIIIWLGKGSFNMCFDVIFDNFEDKNDFFDVYIDKKKYPLICTFHTSARKSDYSRAMDVQIRYKAILKSEINRE